MNSVIVASRPWRLAVSLVAWAVGLRFLVWLLPNYGPTLEYGWWLWLAGLAWLGWSLVAPLLLVKRVEIDPQVRKSLRDFEAAIQRIEQETGNLERAIQDAEVYQRELVKQVVVFICKADELSFEQDSLRSGNLGRISVLDADLAQMLERLEPRKRDETLDYELGVRGQFEVSLRFQAERIRSDVMKARGLLTAQKAKLMIAGAEVPYLRMDQALESCLAQLPNIQRGMSPAGMIGAVKRRLIPTDQGESSPQLASSTEVRSDVIG